MQFALEVASAGSRLDDYLDGPAGAWHRVVDAASRLFRERGYSVVTMHDIAREVGLSKAGLYHHCPSKERILADIVGLCGDILLRQLEDVRDLSASPGERLRRFVVSRMETITRHQDLFTVFWQERPFIDRVSFGGIAKSAEAYRAGVRALIEDGKGSGEIRPDADAHMLMLAIDGMTGWAYVWFRREGSANPTQIGETFWSFLAQSVVQPTSVSRAAQRPKAQTRKVG